MFDVYRSFRSTYIFPLYVASKNSMRVHNIATIENPSPKLLSFPFLITSIGFRYLVSIRSLKMLNAFSHNSVSLKLSAIFPLSVFQLFGAVRLAFIQF